MKITLCGSTKFQNDYISWNKRLSIAGHVVYSVAAFGHKDPIPLTDAEKTKLDLVRLAKIDASDAIVLVDMPYGDDPAYIGESSSREWQWAEMRGKLIFSVSGKRGGDAAQLLSPPRYIEAAPVLNLFRDIGDFHRKFDLPPVASHPKLLPEDMQLFRERFLREELEEFTDAYTAGDLAKAADALVDLTYVALGTAYLMGVPFNELWMEVHRANMTKARVENIDESTRKSKYDVIKPKGWQPPNIEGILVEHGAEL